MFTRHDAFMLECASHLAARGGRDTRPNPMVGAVVCARPPGPSAAGPGAIVGSGYHRAYGGLHAEAWALEAAGEAAAGSTLYCNLEPCSHSGPSKHQPPCTGRIIDAGVRRVVIGQLDPNPAVRGEGVRLLRQAGIEVDLAPDDAPFIEQNEIFNTLMSAGRPFVHLKAAMSLNGAIATASGDSKWITDTEARADGHRLRADSDAIMVGIGTVEADNPLLTVRHVDGPDPRPVVMDSMLRISPECRLVAERGEELIVLAAAPGCDVDRALALRRCQVLEDAGVRVVFVAADQAGRPRLRESLEALLDLGLYSVLVEGGAVLHEALIAAGLYDRISVYLAPLLIGGGRSAFGGFETPRVADALRLEAAGWEPAGAGQVFRGRRPGWLDSVRNALTEDQHVHRAG